ncbi:MAG: glycosyltransferase family 4 protein [Clostridia bacterium]|nr:glycosyltransferase family 4 protein [Clostridia bacterium]MDD4665488.1 glycosyltransferase family 4 protein [Clostridia bacterium]
MKILFVTTISNAINAFLIPHIELLLKQGHEVDLACNIVREVSPELLRLGCKVHKICFQRSPLKKDNYTAYKKIKRLVLSEGYEVIHTHTPVASFLTRLACRKMAKVKILYTAHGFHFYQGAPLKNWLIYYPLEKAAARWTDSLITMNKEDYKLAHKFKLRKAKAIHKVNGVGIDLQKFVPQTLARKRELRKKYGYNDDDFILIYAAELNYNKHQDLLIKAVKLVRNKMPGIKLLLAGSGSLAEQYKKQVKRLGLEENISFLGHRDDIAALLLLSDLAVSSSRREGLPVNVMEAMATGLPLVVTDSRGNRDLVSDGGNGYVVGINDVPGFAGAIEKLYSSAEIRQRFSEKSLDLVKRYALERVKEEMKEIYAHYL